jgi:hypothetical protein
MEALAGGLLLPAWMWRIARSREKMLGLLEDFSREAATVENPTASNPSPTSSMPSASSRTTATSQWR